MTLAAPTNAPASTLGGVLRTILYYFIESGNATPIMVGDHYMTDRGVGFDARVVLVPESKGDVGAALRMGDAGSFTEACDVHIRAAESGDDIGRYDAARALRDKMFSAIRRACTGRLDLREYRPSSPSKVDGFGAQVSFTFLWAADIRKDPAIYDVPAPTAEVLALYFPDVPSALPATAAVTVSAVVKEDS